jgi:hypothetical protein
MTTQDIKEWLKPIVRNAAAKELKEEPKDVIIRRSDMTVVRGVTTEPVHKVWARVILAKSSYEVIVNVGGDGSYGSFRVVG